MIRVIAAALLVWIAAGAAASDPRSAATREITALLDRAARTDGNPILSLSELETLFGPHDEVATRSLFGSEAELVWQLSAGRKLQIWATEGRVVYGAVVPREGKWELVWK